jgi:hypothetical protein
MKLSGKAALLTLSFVFAVPALARAGTSVFVDLGGIAFGYEDGYWDRDHRWHEWERREDWDRYRREYREHAYAWRHDHDGDGWRDEYWHDNGKHKGWYKHHGHGHDD